MAAQELLDDSVEMRLEDNSQQKLAYKQLEDIYSIMMACEHLETAYLSRDAISASMYTDHCKALIGKYEQAVKIAQASSTLKDVNDFLATYSINLPYAKQRLLIDKVPATAVHMQGGEGRAGGEEVAALQLMPAFITLMDVADIFVVPEQVVPHLVHLAGILAGYTGMPIDWEGREVVDMWMRKFTAMDATEMVQGNDKSNFKLQMNTCFEQFRHTAVSRAEARSRK